MTRLADIAIVLATLLPAVGALSDVALVGLVLVVVAQLPRITAPGHSRHGGRALVATTPATLTAADEVALPQASPRFLIASRR